MQFLAAYKVFWGNWFCTLHHPWIWFSLTSSNSFLSQKNEVMNAWPNQSYICTPVTKYSKHWPYTLAHTIDRVRAKKKLNHGLNYGFFFHFSSFYPAPYIELNVCYPTWISYLNFRAVLVLPKVAGSAQTHKSMFGALYLYISGCTEKFS